MLAEVVGQFRADFGVCDEFGHAVGDPQRWVAHDSVKVRVALDCLLGFRQECLVALFHLLALLTLAHKRLGTLRRNVLDVRSDVLVVVAECLAAWLNAGLLLLRRFAQLLLDPPMNPPLFFQQPLLDCCVQLSLSERALLLHFLFPTFVGSSLRVSVWCLCFWFGGRFVGRDLYGIGFGWVTHIASWPL